MMWTPRIKETFSERLCKEFTSYVSAEEFNEIFLFLEKYNACTRIVPNGVFERSTIWPRLSVTDGGRVFEKFLLKSTSHIDNPYNKSRKLVRILQEFLTTYELSLPYTLKSSMVLPPTLVVFYTMGGESDREMAGYYTSSESGVNLEEKLEHLRNFYACLFFMETLREPSSIETVVSLFAKTADTFVTPHLISLALDYELGQDG